MIIVEYFDKLILTGFLVDMLCFFQVTSFIEGAISYQLLELLVVL